MREIILLFLLISLVLCPYPGSTEEDFEPKRQEIKKKLSNQIKECILQKNITQLFREQIQANPNENIIIIKHKIRKNLTKRDRRIFRNCSKEIGINYMKSFEDKRFKKAYEKTYLKHLRKNNTV